MGSQKQVGKQMSPIFIHTSGLGAGREIHSRTGPQSLRQGLRADHTDQPRDRGCRRPALSGIICLVRFFAQWDGKRKMIGVRKTLQKKKILLCHILPKSRLRYFLFLTEGHQRFPMRTRHGPTQHTRWSLSWYPPSRQKSATDSRFTMEAGRSCQPTPQPNALTHV